MKEKVKREGRPRGEQWFKSYSQSSRGKEKILQCNKIFLLLYSQCQQHLHINVEEMEKARGSKSRQVSQGDNTFKTGLEFQMQKRVRATLIHPPTRKGKDAVTITLLLYQNRLFQYPRHPHTQAPQDTYMYNLCMHMHIYHAWIATCLLQYDDMFGCTGKQNNKQGGIVRLI